MIALQFRFYLFCCLLILTTGTLLPKQGKDGTKTKNRNENTSIKSDNVLLEYNNISFPLDNKGVLCDINGKSGKIGGNTFLFSGGFYLSGKAGATLWGNGVLTSSRIVDYIPGPVDSSSLSTKNSIFIVTANDPPFGMAWQNWKDAVKLGAGFYDGDGDGIYFPVDKNGNGIWDANEDKPDIPGDFVAWCVYNDGVPKELRVFNTIDSQGIEIRQTVFGFSSGLQARNTIFIKYQIVNRGTKSNVLDSVYFSSASDPDIGDGSDDLVGCDTLLNSAFTYNNGPDGVWGSKPPAFLVDLIQEPSVYIPNVTFIDKNGNGIYDKDIDSVLQYAVQLKGKNINADTLPGAMNLPMTSFTQYIQSHPTIGDPITQSELRNYMLGGRFKNGTPVNPCSWIFGNGSLLSNCTKINPLYMYSGDPVFSKGWLNTNPNDQRMMVNAGPFKLEKDKPVNIIVAYIAVQGSSALNSLKSAKDYAASIQKMSSSGFILTSLKTLKNEQAVSYKLNQNYPNPFNPSTKIQYALKKSGRVSLTLYNLLGEQLTKLVDCNESAGMHEVVFDAKELNSGVYFYRLITDNFQDTKKLMLVK